MEIRLSTSGLTIYEMTTMNQPELTLFLATRHVEGLPKEEGISCIIGMSYFVSSTEQYS